MYHLFVNINDELKAATEDIIVYKQFVKRHSAEEGDYLCLPFNEKVHFPMPKKGTVIVPDTDKVLRDVGIRMDCIRSGLVDAYQWLRDPQYEGCQMWKMRIPKGTEIIRDNYHHMTGAKRMEFLDDKPFSSYIKTKDSLW